MDRPSTSKAYSDSEVECIDLIEPDADEEDTKQKENDDDEALQKALESWRNYGQKKRNKLDVQHEDDLEFFGFAATFLNSSDEATLQEFKHFLNSPSDGDTYSKIDQDVAILLDDLMFNCSNLKGLFTGVCIWVNGWTYPVARTLHRLVQLAGGDYCLTYNPHKVTHSISTVISMSNLKSERHQQNTVNPEWIIESLKQNKLLPLYDYRVIKPKNDIKRMFEKLKKSTKPSHAQECIETDHEKTKYREFLPNKIDDIDAETMGALPAEILQEIQQAMNKQSKPVKAPIFSTSSKAPIFASSSKTPVMLPGSRKKKIPESAKKKSGVGQTRIDILMSKQRNRCPADKMYELYSGKLDRKFGANLCGLKTPEGVTEVLQEWILQEAELRDQDVSYLLGYFSKLIDAKNFDLLCELLITMKFLIDTRRDNGGLECDSWRAFFFDTLKGFLQCEPELWNNVPREIFFDQ